VSDYTKAMKNYTISGVHRPDFMYFVEKKPQIYYYRLYVLEHPECHKAFNVLLDDTLFSESTDIKCSKRKTKVTKLPGSNEKKAIILKDVAASMTAAFTETQAHSAKQNEKSRLEQNIGTTVMINLLIVPDGEKGERARTFFNKQITENENRVGELKEWFLENPSPTKK
jgi:hypothetical protein